MIWNNRGHQLDELGKQYLKVKRLYLFGMDETSKKMLDFLEWLNLDKDFDIFFIWDKTEHESEIVPEVFCGKKVICYDSSSRAEDIVKDIDNSVVVLKSYGHTRRRDLLLDKGISNIFYMNHSHNNESNFVQNFVCIYMMYRHNILVSHWTNYLVTLKCNLNCHCCLNYTEFLSAPADVTFEDFTKHFDILFSKFDFLYSLHLVGGEPLLTKDLVQKIGWLKENYGNRIFEFFVVTNGTIIPSDEVINAIASLNGYLSIDDYGESVSNSKVQELTKKLCEKGLPYNIIKAPYWYDLAIQNTDYSQESEEFMEKHKDNCHKFLHEFADGRIYACCYQKYANRANLAKEEYTDYVEISNCSKMEILEFRQGYTEKGYTSMCRNCRGMGDCALQVEPAIQVPRERR